MESYLPNHKVECPGARQTASRPLAYRPSKGRLSATFGRGDVVTVGTFLTPWLALFSVGALCATCRAEASFDRVFTEVKDGVVLQVNTEDEPGRPVFRARLFGSSTNSHPVTLRFRRSSSAVVKLGGQKIPRETDPAEFPPESAQIIAKDNKHFWSWEGVFEAPEDLDFSKETISIELSDGDNPKRLRVRLGDAWFVAGGENVRRSWSASSNKEPGFDFSADFSVVTYTPQTTQPTNWLLGAPQLATHVAFAFGQTFNRPQMIVTVGKPRWSTAQWKNARVADLAPLSGADGQFKGLGVRGAIWWVGEDAADAAPPADMLPGEFSVNAAHMAFRQWQEKQCAEIKAAMKNLAELLALGDPPPSTEGAPPDTTSDPAVGKQTFLMVQAPGVWRQPKNFANISFSPAPWSSWELLRAAQTDAARDWRADSMRRVTFRDVTPPLNEDIGFRAFLVATLPGKDQGAFATPRWQWDRPDDDARYAALAARLSDAAKRARRWKKDAAAAANIATVDWSDKKNAIVKIPGAKEFDPPVNGELPLEYLTAAEGATWKTVTTWNAKEQIVGETNETVIAIRYGPGDRAGSLRTIVDVNGNQAGLLPAFTAYRDTVTR